MRVVKSVPVDEIAFRGSIKDGDAVRLAQGFRASPLISDTDAMELIRLNKECGVQAPNWAPFLVDTIAEYAVNHREPEGYMTAEKSQWLVSQIATDGLCATRTDLDILLAVIERARWVPRSLAVFALNQVKCAVEHGFGPLRQGQSLRPGTIQDGEVEIVRQVLTSFGSGTRLALTKAEISCLLDINAALPPSHQTPAWSALFTKAVANVVLAAEGYLVPDRALALRVEHGASLASTAKERIEMTLAWTRRDYVRGMAEEYALARLERQRIEIVTGDEFYDPSEVQWTKSRFMDARRRRGEEALVVNYLIAECLIEDAGVGLERAEGGRAA